MDKPLGRKSYGHIPHLPGSRMGPADKHCHAGQARICTEQARDKRDTIYVSEKLDGSNCCVARLEDGRFVALGRAGYLAETSRFEQHHLFADWVGRQGDRWPLLKGQRIIGEWMAQAHGTVYDWEGEPFVPFDLMEGPNRLPYDDLLDVCVWMDLKPAHVFAEGPTSIEAAMECLGDEGFYGALDPVEGAVWRVERDIPHKGVEVDFLAKYVRPDKEDGKYLPEASRREAVWNWRG